MNVVLRNNMLTCTLLGIRESLRRLVNKRKRHTQNSEIVQFTSTSVIVPGQKKTSAATLADLYSNSPVNPLFKTEEGTATSPLFPPLLLKFFLLGTVVDMRSGNEESDSDIDTFVMTPDHDAASPKPHIYVRWKIQI